MRIVVAVLAGLLTMSYWAHSLEIDIPPRAASRPKLLRCCHCSERDAWTFCDRCGNGFCVECEPAHEIHREVV